MDEAYKILKKEEHPHWDKFKAIHSEKTVNYVRTLLGDKVDKDRFLEVYKRLTSTPNVKKSKKGKRRGGLKRRAALSMYDFLSNKAKWIK